jgi:hypothetical protein
VATVCVELSVGDPPEIVGLIPIVGESWALANVAKEAISKTATKPTVILLIFLVLVILNHQ